MHPPEVSEQGQAALLQHLCQPGSLLALLFPGQPLLPPFKAWALAPARAQEWSTHSFASAGYLSPLGPCGLRLFSFPLYYSTISCRLSSYQGLGAFEVQLQARAHSGGEESASDILPLGPRGLGLCHRLHHSGQILQELLLFKAHLAQGDMDNSGTVQPELHPALSGLGD